MFCSESKYLLGILMYILISSIHYTLYIAGVACDLDAWNAHQDER